MFKQTVQQFKNQIQYSNIENSFKYKFKNYQMGNTESQQAAQQQSSSNKQQTSTNSSKLNYYEHEEFFVIQQLERIKLSGSSNDMIFLWIDPRIYNDQNGKNLRAFKQKLSTIEQFSSLGSLQNQLSQIDTNHVVIVISAASLPDENYKFMNNERRIAEIVLFCQNEERAKLLMSNFNKIKTVGYTSSDVLSIIAGLEKKYPQKGLIKNSVLFMTEDDAAIMNKYRLNYYCLTNQRNKNKAKQDFESLAKKLYPQQLQAIEDFAKKYSVDIQNQQERRKQTVQWIFRDSFYWNLVQNLPKVTTDPRKLAYLRLPVKDIYDAILNDYKQKKKKPQSLHIVLELSEDEKQKIAENQYNFMTFTTFVKGYTDERKAKQEYSRLGPNGFKFDILLSRKLHEQLDFGYLVVEDDKKSPLPNVVFNLYNFFKITEFNMKIRMGTLEYGSLAEAFKLRIDPAGRAKLCQQQKNLLRNYDYLEDLMKKIRNQGNVLQLSGYYKESIEIYDKKLEEITRTNKPATMLDEYRIQKGDALKMSEQYELAQKEYDSVKSSKLQLVAKVRLIELHWMRRTEGKVQEIIDQLEKEIDLLKDYGFMEDYFRAKNYIGLSLMKKEKFRQANKFFKALRGQITGYYDFRAEGIPLAHEICRNLALTQTRLNNHEQALNLLNSTKTWQKSSEGKGPTLILTEKMIQNVHFSKGDKQAEEQCRENIQKMIIDQSAVGLNIDASHGAVKVQQSIQQSLVNIDLDTSNNGGGLIIEKKAVNVEQSAIDIDF